MTFASFLASLALAGRSARRDRDLRTVLEAVGRKKLLTAFFLQKNDRGMLNMIRRIAILVMMASMVCFVSAVSAAEPIKVGAAINLTGPASSWGQYHAKGQQDYFKYVNEVKGGVAGRKIEMILVDTGYKVPEAIAAVRKFADQSKVDIIATWGAGEGLAAKPIIQSYKIPTINFSTSWEILEPPIGFMYSPLWQLPDGLLRNS